MKIGLLAATMALLLVAGYSLSAQAGSDADTDGDGVIDFNDFCSNDPAAPNPIGCDTDHDGYGNLCDGDFNNDGAVNVSDINILFADLNLGTDPGDGSDMNCDGAVNVSEIVRFITKLNEGAPGPSGLPCAGTVPCP